MAEGEVVLIQTPWDEAINLLVSAIQAERSAGRVELVLRYQEMAAAYRLGYADAEAVFERLQEKASDGNKLGG